MIRESVRTGKPFGAAGWVEEAVADLMPRREKRPRGRPRKASADGNGQGQATGGKKSEPTLPPLLRLPD